MLATLAVLTALAVFTVSVGGFAAVHWFNGSVSRVHLSLGPRRPVSAPPGTANWLLVGTDSRVGTGDEYGSVDGARSDTTILAHLDADGTVTNVSFPRDTLVTIPAYSDAQGHARPAHQDKFNAAIALGGPSLLVRTVENMTGIRIDHYVAVDLAGFKRVSEVIGGVEVCLLPSSNVETTTEAGITHTSTNLHDSYSGFNGMAGEQTVVGDQALAFVRQRHGLVNGDIGRIQRQQQFLGAVFRKATASNVLLDPVEVTQLLSAFRDALTLDQNTSLADLEQLALRLRGVAANQLRFETVPQRSLSLNDTALGQVFVDAGGILELIPKEQTNSVGSVQILDVAAFRQMIDALRTHPPTPAAGTPPSAMAPSQPVADVPPSQVLVEVANGTTNPDLAARARQDLARHGFRVDTSDAPADGIATTEVRFAAPQRAEAETLAAAVPGATLVQDEATRDTVVLVVGENYSGVRAVSLRPAPSPLLPTAPLSAANPPGAPPAVDAASPSNRCTY